MKTPFLLLMTLLPLFLPAGQRVLPERFEILHWLEMEADLPGRDSRVADMAALLLRARREVTKPENLQTRDAALNVLEQIDRLLTAHGLVYRSSTGRDADVLLSPALTPARLSEAERAALLAFDPAAFAAELRGRSQLWRLGRPEPTPAQQERLRDFPDAPVYFADCDRLSILYWAIGRELGLPLEFVSAPRHAFVRWRFEDGSHLNWETTNGTSPPDRFYENFPGNSPEAIARGTYLSRLTDTELWGYWLAMRGQVHLAQGRQEAAEADLRHSLALYPANPIVWNRLGLLEELRGNAAAALEAFAEGLTQDPAQASLWFNRARIHRDQGRFSEAALDLREALRFDPRHDGGWSMRGELFQNRGNLPAALQDFTRALELNPNNLHSLTGRSHVFRAMGRPAGALADSTRAHELDPLNPIHLGNRALAFYQLGRLEEGLADLDASLELDPGNILLRANRAAFRAKREDYEGAVADYTQVIALDPSFASAYRGRAAALTLLGRPEEARADHLRFQDLSGE